MILSKKVWLFFIHQFSYEQEELFILGKHAKFLYVFLLGLYKGRICEALDSLNFFIDFFFDGFVIGILFEHVVQYGEIMQLFWLKLVFWSWMVHLGHGLINDSIGICRLNWFLFRFLAWLFLLLSKVIKFYLLPLMIQFINSIV